MANPAEKLKAVQAMQDHIEARLSDPITLHELARCTRYSVYYAARIFKEVTGKTPFEYIRLRRLAAAANRLHGSEAKIIDVAFDFVFDSHEGFTRAFSRHFSMTPSEFRRAKPPVSPFMPEQMRVYYTTPKRGKRVMNEKKTETNTVFVQVLERPARKLIVKRGQKAEHYFDYCEEVGCEVWNTLAAIKETIHEPMGLWLPDKLRPEGTSKYVQGVEVATNYAGPVPEGFDTLDLPPCRMMVFQGQPFDDEAFEQAITSLWDVIDGYTPETIGYQWADEDGPRFQLEPVGYRGYIEGRPVRPVDQK
ncbi:MAG: AraC family transcriptional regulator [Myxococcota bacterium]|nr:AraC family transcriptional regulator [Myxococcota bacterium]